MKNKAALPKNEQEWQQQLDAEQFKVLRLKGTERAFTGRFYDHFEPGTYVCAGCEAPLFKSDTKFDAHCGWPSFYDQIDREAVTTKLDTGHGMIRTEILCANCGGHLGHVFNDGPGPKGLRYCVNSVSIDFKEERND